MATSSHAPLEGKTHNEPDVGSTPIQAAAVGTIYSVLIDNTDNTAAVYFKGWWRSAADGAPTVGTTPVSNCFKVAAGTTRFHAFNGGQGFDDSATTGNVDYYFAVVTTGGKAGSTSPTNDVSVVLTTSA
jgi:hypothetical protein